MRSHVDGQLDFDAPSGLDCRNDHADWGHAHGLFVADAPGGIAPTTLLTTTGGAGLDAVSATVTLVSE